MLTKWKTSRYYHAKIERVECTRETDKAVWVLEHPWTLEGLTKTPIERRRAKQSDSDNYHDTWEDAHAYLLKMAEYSLARARVRLADAQGALGNVKGLRKPVEQDARHDAS